MRDYVPHDEDLLVAWARNFSATIATDPVGYGILPSDVQAVATVVADYVSAFNRANDPTTRVRASIIEKNAAKSAMVKVLRRYAQQIRINPTVSDALKVNLKLRPAPSDAQFGRAGSTEPTTRPVLRLKAVEPLRHVLGYGDLLTPGRSKPAHVAGLQLFCHVGSAAPDDPQNARFIRFLTRQPYPVDFKPEQVGKTAFYFARWQNATGETGPWSQVLTMTVAG